MLNIENLNYKIDNKKIGKRLAELRNSKGYSQTDLGLKFEEMKTGHSADYIDSYREEYGNIKNSISQLERGAKGLTIENATLYAELFGVSFDYLYCRSDDWQPHHKSAKETLHLTDKAINNIIDYCDDNNQENNPSFKLFNLMIENKYFFHIIGKIFEHILMFHVDELDAIEKSVTDSNISDFLIDNKNYELWGFSRDMIEVFENVYEDLLVDDEAKQSLIELAQLARVSKKLNNRVKIYDRTKSGEIE